MRFDPRSRIAGVPPRAAAPNRVATRLRTSLGFAARGSPGRQRAVLAAGVGMFIAVLILRFASNSDSEPILLLELFPITLIAVEFGIWAGLAAGIVALVTWCIWAATSDAQVLDVTDFAVRAPVFLITGSLVGWLSDLDSRQLHQLAESERDLRFIAEESNDMISTYSADGDYVFVSGTCRQLLGYEPEELIGSSGYVYIHPDDVETVTSAHADTLARPEIVTTTYRLRRKDGTYVWVQSKSRARRDPYTDEVEEIHCATRDVSTLESGRELSQRAHGKARQRIARTLAAGEPTIVYQPIYDLERRRVVAVEALARFSGRPQRPPNVWFDEAWSAGLGLEMELVAIREALAGFRNLPEQWALMVNASAETVQAGQLLKLLGDAPERVVVEVTENAAVADLTGFVSATERLRQLGVRLAIDDVGTGFSGLSRLLDLQPDVIKLDLSLTRGVDKDLRRGALTTSLVAFGREAGIDVVAEGIETKGELEALLARGVRYGQGYFLGMPTPSPAELVDAVA